MKKPLVLTTPEEMRHWRKSQSQSIGFVPTMGALHDGHRSLLDRSVKENEFTVLSIFVNPAQFNNPNDLAKYPKTWEADLRMAEDVGVTAVFAPTKDLMYPDEYKYRVIENELSAKFCGAHRPGHFDGVLTIVMKLFHVVAPHRAYFGEKDYQQLLLVKNMVSAFFMDVDVVAVPTLRDSSGLAMSSRNTLLSDRDRKTAEHLNEILRSAQTPPQAAAQLQKLGFEVDYVEDFQDRRLAAATLGSVRLIDNVKR